MELPIPILIDLPPKYAERWLEFYVRPSDRNRRQEEGIWRRTQSFENASESDWKGPDDCRRRIVYYLHDFDLIENKRGRYDLVISQVYIYYSLLLPHDELSFVEESIYASLLKGGWHRNSENRSLWQRGKLLCLIDRNKEHMQDILAQRKFPDNYQCIDITIRTASVGNVKPHLPWEVLAKGMRIKDVRQTPSEHPDLSILKKLIPFHVEIGCGPSIEAGVPALHHLHNLYCVTNLDTGKFIFGGQQDNLIRRLLTDPEREFSHLGSLFSASFLAEPTKAHRAISALKTHGYLIEPILTNNFDGLAQRAGLSEQFLRRYDEAIPYVEFNAEAKALLVIGSHADRRRVQARAREKGLQIVYLDPEGYYLDGYFIPYPLEGPKKQDIICRKPATEGLVELCRILGIEL